MSAATAIALDLDILTPAERKVFKMRTVDGLTYSQTARDLGRSINTVKVQFRSARRKLKIASLPLVREKGGLTSREMQIARLVAAGKTTKEISIALDLSSKTIDTHRASLYQRLGVHNSPSMVVRLLEIGVTL